MARKHTQALVAKIQEIPALAAKTFTTVAPHDTAAPYAIVHPARGTNSQERVTGPRVTRRPRYTLHIVGESADQVQVLADLLEEKLFPAGRGVVLTVAGEIAKPLWFESPIPIQVQTDPQPTVIYLVVELGWRSDPAPTV